MEPTSGLRRSAVPIFAALFGLILAASCAGSQAFLGPFPEDWTELKAAEFPPGADAEPRWVGWSVPADAPAYFGGRDPVEGLGGMEEEIGRRMVEQVQALSRHAAEREDSSFLEPVPLGVTAQARCAARAILANRSAGDHGPSVSRVFDDVIMGRCGLPSTAIHVGRVSRISLGEVTTMGLEGALTDALTTIVYHGALYISVRQRQAEARSDSPASLGPPTFDWAISWNMRRDGSTYVVESVLVLVPLHTGIMQIEPFAMADSDGRFVIEGALVSDAVRASATILPLPGGPTLTCVDDRTGAQPGRFRLACVLPPGVDDAILDIGHFRPGGGRTLTYVGAARIPIARGGSPPNQWGVSPPSIAPPRSPSASERTLAWLNALLAREGARTVPRIPSLEQLARMAPDPTTSLYPVSFMIDHWRAPEPHSIGSSHDRDLVRVDANPWEAAVAIRYSTTFTRNHFGQSPLVGVALVQPDECDPTLNRCLQVVVLASGRMEVDDPDHVESAIRDHINAWRAMLELPPLAHASTRTRRLLNGELPHYRTVEGPRRRPIYSSGVQWSYHYPRNPGVHPEYWAWWTAGPSFMVLPPELLAPDPPRVAISTFRECNSRRNACHDLVLIGIE